MATASPYKRLAWADRFRQPTTEGLREGLSGDALRLFTAARKHLLQVEGVEETPAWYGASWRWSLEYRVASRAEPLAVLIPSPQDLQLAIQFDREQVTELARKPMKRAIRDGLELARDPFDTRWAVWSIQPHLLEDLCKLIDLKVKRAVAKPAAAKPAKPAARKERSAASSAKRTSSASTSRSRRKPAKSRT
jgi:hypothetical protein